MLRFILAACVVFGPAVVIACGQKGNQKQDQQHDPAVIKVPSRLDGVVSEVKVKKGQRVRKDEILATLDSVEASVRLNIARSEVDRARAELESAKAIAEECKVRLRREEAAGSSTVDISIARTIFQKAQASSLVKEVDVRIAEFKYQLAQRNLEIHTIRAPFDGVVERVLRQPSEAVRQYETIIELRPDKEK